MIKYQQGEKTKTKKESWSAKVAGNELVIIYKIYLGMKLFHLLEIKLCEIVNLFMALAYVFYFVEIKFCIHDDDNVVYFFTIWVANKEQPKFETGN